MVIRTSNIIPEMREAFFRCNVCSNTASVEVDRGRILEPTLCAMCNTGHSFSIIHNRSQFSDRQMVKLQESPGKRTDLNYLSLVVLIVACYDRRHACRSNSTHRFCICSQRLGR